jgi:hypothetical protein
MNYVSDREKEIQEELLKYNTLMTQLEIEENELKLIIKNNIIELKLFDEIKLSIVNNSNNDKKILDKNKVYKKRYDS